VIALSIVALLCAVVPAAVFWVNLRLYIAPTEVTQEILPRVSVLIPARNEEAGIRACVESVLASAGVDFEVVVMDDASTDRTAEIVRELARQDPRLRLEAAPALPRGWNGKQHACWALAHAARHEALCFLDADVRLAPDAVGRMAAFLVRSRNSLVSGFPRQLTGTWLERLLLPLIHFVLLGFLPIGRMRRSTDPAFAAGCGQFIMVDRAAYFASGGHAAIRETMHDGLLLPRQLRRHGYSTDLADITSLATCRMYRSAAEVWMGLAKNATEGLASPARIVPVSLLLLVGQVVPFARAIWVCFLVSISLFFGPIVTLVHPLREAAFDVLVFLAVLAAWLPRLLGVRRFRQSPTSAVLHPVGILFLLALQWYALARKAMGGAVSWRSRTYAGE
jgi:glycosyltransferase involved in cell wall biosynthesis